MGWKRDLVPRDVVVQKKDSGGFPGVSVKFKVQYLVVHSVKRYLDSHGGGISLLTYWLFDRFGIDLPTILESHSLFSLVLLPLFYKAVFNAWKSLEAPAILLPELQPIAVVQILALCCLESLARWFTSVF